MKNTIRGMFMLGRGKREGFHEFSNSSDSVLSALAPWIALAVVVNLLPLFMMKLKDTQAIYISVSVFLVKICSLLATVAIIHAFSVLWKNENNWKQTTVAVLWCFWVPILDCILFFLIIGLLFSGMPNILMALFGLSSILYIAYSLWLNWFVIKIGLQITALRSIVVIVTLILVSIVIYSVFLMHNYSYMMQMAHDLQQQMQNQVKSIQ